VVSQIFNFACYFELTFLQMMRRRTTMIGEWPAWKEFASTLAGDVG
jgi:hypothetical protein